GRTSVPCIAPSELLTTFRVFPVWEKGRQQWRPFLSESLLCVIGATSISRISFELPTLESVTFVEVAPSGVDVYEGYANGGLSWIISLTSDGRLANAGLQPLASRP